MIKKILTTAAISCTLASTNAFAILYDFDALTEEQGASTLDLFGGDLLVTGHNGGSSAYAYLDAGSKSGVGVCNDIDLAGDTAGDGNDHVGGSNECAPSSDDNMQGDEWLDFTSTTDNVLGFYVWGNHTAYSSASIFVDTDGSGDNFVSLAVDANRFVSLASYDTSTFSVKSDSNVAAYISGVSVPEPGSLALLALGLAGLGISRRKK